MERRFIPMDKSRDLHAAVRINMADITKEKEGKSKEKLPVFSPVDETTELSEELSKTPESKYPEERTRWRGVPPLSGEQVLTACAFWGVILLGAILRFWALGDKPLHHDESLHGYFSLQLLQNTIEKWASCFNTAQHGCYRYDPLLHGPFQFHAMAVVYRISRLLGVPNQGVNTTTVRIVAVLLGTVVVGLPYFLRHYLGTIGAWLACFLLAISPSMVYFSRFAREDIYMACFTLLLVVAVAEYIRTRSMVWFLTAAVAFSLSYATKEATFLTIAIYGSFFGALLAWEFGSRWSFSLHLRSKQLVANDKGEDQAKEWPGEKFMPRTTAPVALLFYLVVLGVLARWFFDWLKNLSIFVTENKGIANNFVTQLKEKTQLVVPWLGILLAAVVVVVLLLEQRKQSQSEERRGLARWVDPKKQPLLDAIVTMPWQHLFFGFVLAWTVFMVLFTALFTHIPQGIGEGIWQGIYYWLEQQEVARGGQPWYYYLLLIPLYEQIGLTFGLVGIVSCLRHPSRFRLFLVYWLVGNVLIYSWAAEKMPWLTIHMTMPLILLAAIGLQLVVVKLIGIVKGWRTARLGKQAEASSDKGGRPTSALSPRQRIGGGITIGSAVFGAIVAAFTLVLTLQNMFQVVYVRPADAPHEMMIYVQTTTSVNTIMEKVDQLDRKWFGGKHQMPVGVMSDATWPFAWYLRDYPHACFQFPNAGCPDTAKLPVIISGGDDLGSIETQYGQQYAYRQYEMRSQWNQGYMPPPCVATSTHPCEPQQYTGVGPLPWLSYGNNPPRSGQFDLGLIAKNVWRWWWQRIPFGDIDSGYGMALLIRKDLGIRP